MIYAEQKAGDFGPSKASGSHLEVTLLERLPKASLLRALDDAKDVALTLEQPALATRAVRVGMLVHRRQLRQAACTQFERQPCSTVR